MSGAEDENQNPLVYGPQVKRPLKIRALRYASLVLATAGLVLLYLFSIHRDIPTVKIGDIQPTMNFATVRIEGEVTRNATRFKSGGLVFNLKDGTGELAVLGGRAQADALEETGKLPRRGDQVDVVGTLSVSADQEIKLRMRSSDQLTVHRKQRSPPHPSSTVSLADVTASRKGETVTVLGTLKTIEIPGPGCKTPYVLTLEENGAELAVVFWETVFQGMNHTLPEPGKLTRARGRVDVYKGVVQLKIWEAEDLLVVNASEKLERFTK